MSYVLIIKLCCLHPLCLIISFSCTEGSISDLKVNKRLDLVLKAKTELELAVTPKMIDRCFNKGTNTRLKI